jgi:hypothetical protein
MNDHHLHRGKGFEDAVVDQRGHRHGFFNGLPDAVPQREFLKPRIGDAVRMDQHRQVMVVNTLWGAHCFTPQARERGRENR